MNSKLQFALSAESKEKLDALFTEVSDLQRVIEKYPESQLMLLKPIFERFLPLLSNLGKDLVFVDGKGTFEATSLCNGESVRHKVFGRIMRDPDFPAYTPEQLFDVIWPSKEYQERPQDLFIEAMNALPDAKKKWQMAFNTMFFSLGYSDGQ